MTAVLERAVTVHVQADALHLIADFVARGLAVRTKDGRVQVRCDQHIADALIAAMDDEPEEPYRNIDGDEVIYGGLFNHAWRLRIVVVEVPS